METLVFVSLLMLLVLVLYLWISPELQDNSFEPSRTTASENNVSTQLDEKYFQDEESSRSVASVSTDFSYLTTAYCDSGRDPQSTLDLLPNASYQVQSAGNGFVRIVMTPIEGAESSSIIMTTQSFQAVCNTALRLMKNGVL